jgi:hypothetical protein
MPSEDQVQHLGVLAEAMDIFIEKDALRGDMWRQYPPSDKIREIRERADRLTSANTILARMAEENGDTHANGDLVEETLISDALDTINYAAFLIKQIREGARG